MNPATSPLVTLRHTGAASLAMLASALIAHVGAGGGLPPVSVLAVVLSLLTVVGVAVTGRGVGRWWSLALIGGGQLEVHAILTWTSGWTSTAGSDHAALSVLGHGHAAVLAGRTPAAGHGPGPADAAAVSDLRMLVLHVVATLVTGWVLAQGDRVTDVARAAMRPLWRRPVLRPVPPVGVLEQRVETTPRVPAPSVVCVRRRPRRGPPRHGGVALLTA
jgi:hypothetical protein